MDKESLNRLTDAFGFKEALEALDRLVEQCSVGGKKEKAELEADEDHAGFKAALKEFAKDTRIIYEAFAEAGFDDDQAFELTLNMMDLIDEAE